MVDWLVVSNWSMVHVVNSCMGIHMVRSGMGVHMVWGSSVERNSGMCVHVVWGSMSNGVRGGVDVMDSSVS